MKVRAKFTVTEVSVFGQDGKQVNISVPDPANVPNGAQNWIDSGIPMRKITLSAQYWPDKSPEDRSFAQSTPTGTITFTLTNPDLAEEFKPGEVYYVDFVRAVSAA